LNAHQATYLGLRFNIGFGLGKVFLALFPGDFTPFQASLRNLNFLQWSPLN